MSRRILHIRERGYISKTDGRCYRHKFAADGSHISTENLRGGFPLYLPTCRYAEAKANELGAPAMPGPNNGFRIIQGMNTCANYPDKSLVQVVRGSNYYWLPIDYTGGEIIEATTDDLNNCEELEIDFQIPDNDNKIPLDNSQGNNLTLDNSPLMLVTIMAAVIVLLILWIT